MLCMKGVLMCFFKIIIFIKKYLKYKINYLLINIVSKDLNLERFRDKKILIVTAHPDDEVFCLAHFVNSIMSVNTNINWINTTLGQNSIDSKIFTSIENTAKLREIEFEKSVEYLGISNFINLKIPSYLNSEISKDYLNPVKEWVEGCDYLFLIGKNDKHADHLNTTITFERFKEKNCIFYYNVQKVKYDSKMNYFSTKFKNQLFVDLLRIYSSQKHMNNSFEVYSKVFKKKVFIYNENTN